VYEYSFYSLLEAGFAEMRNINISAVVGISNGGGPVTSGDLGAAASDRVPPERTQVDINSITKTVTGVAMLKLVEQGKVGLQDTLVTLFPNVPRDKAGITVHHLLTHAAGFTDSVGSDEEELTRDGFLKRAFASKLRSSPGKKYRYSNVGFSVLAAIIELKSGKSYEQFLREDVLAGTGFNDMGYMGVYDESRSLRSQQGDPIKVASWGGHEPYWNLIGNGGLISTPADFIRFRQLVSAGKIISPELVQLSQQKHIAEDSDDSHYGYGLVVWDRPGIGRIYWHDGGNDIFSAMWADCPDKGDLLFTAAADAKAGNAIDLMLVFQKHLYGVSED
jgi:CubicO group peptidase (beta-lactamase class C family)